MGIWRPAPSVCKLNKIINFVLSVKLIVGEDAFSPGPHKNLYFISKLFYLGFTEKAYKQTFAGNSWLLCFV